MKWEKGRQNSGYFKKKLMEWKFIDLYLLKFPAGASVPTHKDPVKNKTHIRFNVLLKGDNTFKCEKYIFKFWRFVLFRSDKYKHSLGKVDRDTYLLSLGIAI